MLLQTNFGSNMNKITLIHVTSSTHKASIIKQGLFPTKYSKRDVAEHIRVLFPRIDTNKLLDRVLSDKCAASALLRARLNDNLARLSFMSETSHKYYKNIVDCVHDGGEFFTAIRKALEVVTSVDIPPPYPDAFPIICKAEFNTYFDNEGCRFIKMPDNIKNIPLPNNSHIEISIEIPLTPTQFTVHSEKKTSNQ